MITALSMGHRPRHARPHHARTATLNAVGAGALGVIAYVLVAVPSQQPAQQPRPPAYHAPASSRPARAPKPVSLTAAQRHASHLSHVEHMQRLWCTQPEGATS